jgi:hypothetical protein
VNSDGQVRTSEVRDTVGTIPAEEVGSAEVGARMAQLDLARNMQSIGGLPLAGHGQSRPSA